MKTEQQIRDYFEGIAGYRLKWKKRNRFYHRSLEKYFSFLIPENSKVLELGCGTGELLAAVKPSVGVGVDFSAGMISVARRQFPYLQFICAGAADFSLPENFAGGEFSFDYIIMSDLLHVLWDVQAVLCHMKRFCSPSTRIVISNYNFLWEPLLKLIERLGLKQRSPSPNWLTPFDIGALLEMEGFKVISSFRKILVPRYVPLIHFIFNRFLVNLPVLNALGLINFITARPSVCAVKHYPVSIIVPARNEKGNIEELVLRTPVFGLSQEFIFVEGQSTDGTWEEMLRTRDRYPEKNIRVLRQSGKGKGNAVREGFDTASGDVLMILDADLTTPPEELPKFYKALSEGKGEMINGCRLVYPMEKEAMRFLNLLGNKFFSWFFSYLLGQRLKDTLCGTKVLYKSNYENIKANRSYFGDFDPFGDFDLLFGASRLNLDIAEIPVRYRERKYGTTQIRRFRHGWLLFKMSLLAAVKIKFI